MAFTPKTLDGIAAGGRFMKLAGVKKGTCLNAIWRAFGSPKSDGKYNGYPWASDALKGAIAAGALRRGSIADAPPGSVLYWSNVVGNYNRGGKKVYGDAGHIGIKGHGGFWTIDATGNGSLNFVANDALAKKWPWVKFEGYAYGPGAFLGHTVAIAATAAVKSEPVMEDDMFDAKAEARLKDHFTSEANRLAGYVRRESRARWYKNHETGEQMVVKITDGFILDVTGGDSQIESLQKNGYLLLATEEIPQLVDQLRWDNIRKEANAHLGRIAKAVAAELRTQG